MISGPIHTRDLRSQRTTLSRDKRRRQPTTATTPRDAMNRHDRRGRALTSPHDYSPLRPAVLLLFCGREAYLVLGGGFGGSGPFLV